MAEARRRLTVIALSRIEDLARPSGSPTRWWTGSASGTSPSWPASTAGSRRSTAGTVDGDRGRGRDTTPSADRYGDLQAERELRKLVIATERTELDQLLARRKVSERVADGVRAALDVDETTMRP